MNYEAMVTLDQFGFLAIEGRDAVKFLQGYTTCDLDKLGDNQMTRGAICNIQGRMVSNFLACRTAQGLLLRLHRELVKPTEAFLSKYIVFSKAALIDMTDSFHCYGVYIDSLTQQGVDVPQQAYEVTEVEAGKLLRLDDERCEYWSTASADTKGEMERWQHQDLSAGIVWVEPATAEEYMPQMFNLQNLSGISFDKGCYLGQEIVARMQYRGELKKRLHLSTTHSASDDELEIGGRVVDANGKSLGNIVARSRDLCAVVVKAGEAEYFLVDGTPITPTEVTAVA